MIKNGTGGSSTLTGLLYEEKTDIVSNILRDKNIESVKGKYKTEIDFVRNKNLIAKFMIKDDLYKFLKDEFNIDYSNRICSKLKPDSLLLNISNSKVYIIEKKFQKCEGSVDEKLQTCLFKKRQYEKLFSETGYEIIYVYLLNDWFTNKKYYDVLSFIKSVGCNYFFDEIPNEFFGL